MDSRHKQAGMTAGGGNDGEGAGMAKKGETEWKRKMEGLTLSFVIPAVHSDLRLVHSVISAVGELAPAAIGRGGDPSERLSRWIPDNECRE